MAHINCVSEYFTEIKYEFTSLHFTDVSIRVDNGEEGSRKQH